jgi:hypothetical protein
MFTPFLEEVTQAVLKQFGDELHKICFVSPNKRAKLFLDKYFRKHIDKPSFAPKFVTINNFVRSFTKLQVADPVYLNLNLFKVYKELSKTNESFDNFFFWGETLLSDFNDVDKYLINAEDLFRNIQSLKELQDTFDYLTEEQKKLITRFWNTFNFDSLTSAQNDFIEIWKVMNSIYTQFKSKLLENKYAYEGMIYRQVAEEISEGNLDLPNYDKVIFVGFNALNPCEHTLFTWLQNNKKAVFFWDYDDAYVTKEYQEAGKFLKSNIRKYPQEFPVNHNNLYAKDRRITVIETASETAQAATLPEILKEIANENQTFNQSAVVLANEGMLVPVLDNLPNSVPSVNITMGYPVSYAPFYSFIVNIIHVLQVLQASDESSKTIHVKHLLPLLNHAYTRILNPSMQEIVEEWRSSNYTFIKIQEIQEPGFKLFEEGIPQTTHQISLFLRKLTERLAKESETHLTDIEKEHIYLIYKQFTRLADVLEECDVEIQAKTYLQFLKKYIKKIIVPYFGEPLSGLQLMGILETRNIDFEHLVVLSLNENIFPKPSNAVSFIPVSLRTGFGLPTPDYHDAIYAYYFYRLIQRAKNTYLLFNANTSGNNKEASRYIQQLLYDKNLDVNRKSLAFGTGVSENKPIVVTKTPEILAWLAKYSAHHSEKYFSPSALNALISCSLRFYFKYYLKLDTPDEFLEEMDALHFGTILHGAIEKIYGQYTGKEITKEELKNILSKTAFVEGTIDEVIKEEYLKGKNSKLAGNDIVIRSVLIKTLKALLNADMQKAPFKILSLEEKYEALMPLNINSKSLNVRIGGKIDRIDQFGEEVRIIDYKTGKLQNEFSSLESLFESSQNRVSAVFQIILYSWLYESNSNDSLPIQPALYFTRSMFSNNEIDYAIYEKVNRSRTKFNYNERKDEFLQLLQLKLQELFDSTVSFSQTSETKLCEYCDYRNICNR